MTGYNDPEDLTLKSYCGFYPFFIYLIVKYFLLPNPGEKNVLFYFLQRFGCDFFGEFRTILVRKCESYIVRKPGS